MSWGRRRRRSERTRYLGGTFHANRNANLNTPIKDIDSVKAFDKELKAMESVCDRHGRWLRHLKRLRFDTAINACRSLRSCLHARMEWLRLRDNLKSLMQLVHQLDTYFNQRGSTAYPSSLDLPECTEPLQVRLSELVAYHPSEEDYRLYVSLCKRYNEVLKKLDADYQQTHDVIKLSSLPAWKELKKFQEKRKVSSGKEGGQFAMFAGIRQAYSALMAIETGKLHHNKPSEHTLFGWCDPPISYKNDHLFENVREIARMVMRPRVKYVPEYSYVLNDLDEKVPTKAKSPSVKEGYELLTKMTSHALHYRRTAKDKSDRDVFNDLGAGRTISERMQELRRDRYEDRKKRTQPVQRFNELAFDNSQFQYASPAMLTYMHRELRRDDGKAIRIRNKIVHKIMQIGTAENQNRNCHNHVTTVFLASPVHLGGDDYAAPVMYQSTNSSQGASTAYGVALMRRGWPDMYHSHVPHSILPMDTQGRINFVVSQYSPESMTRELVQQLRERIEESCRHFFRGKHDETLRQLTDKQKKARLLRMLREIPQLTREDSYGVSNCVPGTEQFINDLSKLQGRMLGDGKAVDGKSIARAWKKSGYIQMHRFSSVITSLHKAVEADKKRRAEIEAALDARIQEAMDWDGFRFAEQQQVSPVQDTAGPIDVQNSASYVPEVVDESRIGEDGTYRSTQQDIADAAALIVQESGVMEQAADEARENLSTDTQEIVRQWVELPDLINTVAELAVDQFPDSIEVQPEHIRYAQELARGNGDVRIFG